MGLFFDEFVICIFRQVHTKVWHPSKKNFESEFYTPVEEAVEDDTFYLTFESYCPQKREQRNVCSLGSLKSL